MSKTMTTATAASNSLTQSEQQESATYVPLGEKEPVTLTLMKIAHDIATPTKSGKRPSAGDCLRFLNLCRGRELNPWTGDCFMIGFDSQSGPNFEVITAYQALLKRAERSSNFDGLEGGIVVKTGDTMEHRKGCLLMKGEILVGGWAKAYRRDRRIPHESVVAFSVYDSGRSRWKIDPGGMITKCAKAAALREAFPNQTAGLYLPEEKDHVHEAAELGAVIEPQRIETVQEVPPGGDDCTVTESPDWAGVFKRLDILQQGGKLRDAADGPERMTVMQGFTGLDDEQFTALSSYNDELAARASA